MMWDKMDKQEIFNLRWAWAQSNVFEVAQHKEEMWEMWRRVAELDASRMIEVGSYAGGSLYVYAGALKHPSTIVVVDYPIEGDPASGVLRTTIAILKAEGHTVHYFPGDSQDADIIKSVRELMPVADFVHIDGDHTYEYVKADWKNYGTLVRKGGLAALHDVQYVRKAGLPPTRSGQVYDELIERGYKGRQFVQTERLNGKKISGIGLIET